MKNYPRILVAYPTADKKDYCLDEFTDQIRTFTYPAYDTFCVDNSEDPSHVEKLWERGIPAIHEPINGDFREELARHQNIIRDYFLKGKWDYLMMIESDVFTGEAILDKFVAYAEASKASIVTGTYEINREGGTLCLTSTIDARGVRTEKMLGRTHGYDVMGQGVVPLRKLLNDPDGRITATGIGCTLFSREVLEEIPFRVDLKLNKRAFSDTYYFTDAAKAGHEILIDSDLICHHEK